jgi:hypothetical protein
MKSPCELPWIPQSMIISEESLDMTEIPMSSLPDADTYMSLRRVFLKPDGMGSSGDYWKEACFTAVGFGDGLGGSSSQLAISDCANRFMGVNTRRFLTQSIYMEDIMLASNRPKENIKDMVAEVDSGLKKGNFQVKEWILTGQPEMFFRYIYHAASDSQRMCKVWKN